MTTKMTNGTLLIAKERQRQVDGEHWCAQHDDEHDSGELALAAACYALLDVRPEVAAMLWPWMPHELKRKDPIRNLTRSGALIAAELDRHKRAERRAKRRKVVNRCRGCGCEIHLSETYCGECLCEEDVP